MRMLTKKIHQFLKQRWCYQIVCAFRIFPDDTKLEVGKQSGVCEWNFPSVSGQKQQRCFPTQPNHQSSGIKKPHSSRFPIGKKTTYKKGTHKKPTQNPNPRAASKRLKKGNQTRKRNQQGPHTPSSSGLHPSTVHITLYLSQSLISTVRSPPASLRLMCASKIKNQIVPHEQHRGFSDRKRKREQKMVKLDEFLSKKTLIGLGLGQFVSLLNTSTGFTSSELARRGFSIVSSLFSIHKNCIFFVCVNFFFQFFFGNQGLMLQRRSHS